MKIIVSIFCTFLYTSLNGQYNKNFEYTYYLKGNLNYNLNYELNSNTKVRAENKIKSMYINSMYYNYPINEYDKNGYVIKSGIDSVFIYDYFYINGRISKVVEYDLKGNKKGFFDYKYNDTLVESILYVYDIDTLQYQFEYNSKNKISSEKCYSRDSLIYNITHTYVTTSTSMIQESFLGKELINRKVYIDSALVHFTYKINLYKPTDIYNPANYYTVVYTPLDKINIDFEYGFINDGSEYSGTIFKTDERGNRISSEDIDITKKGISLNNLNTLYKYNSDFITNEITVNKVKGNIIFETIYFYTYW